jgi:hypothetical protein
MKETLEEASNKIYPNDGFKDEIYADIGEVFREKFIEGAKWQQEQDENKYSEEDMIKFAFDTYHYISKLMGVSFNQISENKLHAMYNFEQFKKK